MERRQRTGVVTLLFMDMVNSTGLKQQLGDRASGVLFDRHHQLIRETLAQFPEGREIETAGDSFLVVFATPSDAVQFAVQVQAALRLLQEETKVALLDRIGIHLGEVVIRDNQTSAKPGDLYGIQIDICSRVMSLARAGQILMTQSVFESARQVLKGEDLQKPLDWLHHGPYRLQGVDEPVEICEVRRAGLDTGGPPTSTEKAQRQTTPGREEVLGWRPGIGQPVPGTRWILEGKLGAGGFGEVWLGRHLSTKDTRVFKFCFQAERVRYLKRELTLFRLLKERVGNHKNVVRLHDVFLERPPYYVEMDYVEGKDLRSWCEARGGIAQVPLELRLEIVAQVADALQAAHDAGIIHRDIKPANILLAGAASDSRPSSIEVKLTDFGIGQVVSEEYLQGITRAGFTETILAGSSSSHTGTQLYIAPELLSGNPASARSDLYSLAVVLYQLVAGSFSTPLASDWAERVPDPLLQADLRSWLAGEPGRRPSSAREMAERLRLYPARRRKWEAEERRLRTRRVMRACALSAAALGLMGVIPWLFIRNANVRWAREKAVPEITRLADNEEMGAAFELAEKAHRFIPTDPSLANLLGKISEPVDINTQPLGAEVQFKEYRHPEQPWRSLGRTPIVQQRVPETLLRWRISKEGYELMERSSDAHFKSVTYNLEPVGSIPKGMILIAGGEVSVIDLAEPGPERLGNFFIDKFEVSNRQFKEFVDSGGYQKTNFWLVPFVQHGRVISWEQAMALFRDSTGKPGPGSWINGSFPPGLADYPVTGVSWYEAAAYTQFAGKELPTVFHWHRAARGQKEFDWISVDPAIVRFSNFGREGPAPVGHYQGMSPSGAYDMAGNAREWCWNESSGGTRCMAGGGWGDPNYLFYDMDASEPMDRLANRGFRCMKRISGPDSKTALAQVTRRQLRDYSKEQPVSAEVFEAYRRFYDYEKTPVRASAVRTPDSGEPWFKEKITFDGPGGGAQIPAYLFLPRKARPPFQTIVVFPHAGARETKSSETKLDSMNEITDFVESGRAVFHPVYEGTYERHREVKEWSEAVWREYGIRITKEFRRAFDYLETRSDIDTNKLAYFGISWGAEMGPRFVALEPRVKTAIWVVGGLSRWKIPEVIDPFNFVTRVTVPILMLNGRYDLDFPYQISQLPMFEMLGTPDQHKHHVLLEGGHEFPRAEFRKEAISWLNKYFGPPAVSPSQ